MTLFGVLGLIYIVALSLSLITVVTLALLRYQKVISFTTENLLLLLMALISMISSWSYFIIDYYSMILDIEKIPAVIRVVDIWLALTLPFIWFIFVGQKVLKTINKAIKIVFWIICVVCLAITFVNYGLLLNGYYELTSWKVSNFVFTTEDFLAAIISVICLILMTYIVVKSKRTTLGLEKYERMFVVAGTIVMLADGIQTFSIEYAIITNDAYIAPVVRMVFSFILLWYVIRRMVLSQYQKQPQEVFSSDQILDLIAEEYSLTKQETVVTKLLYSGSTYKDIGEYLFISVHTVRRHASNIYAKINVSSKMELIQLVREKTETINQNDKFS